MEVVQSSLSPGTISQAESMAEFGKEGDSSFVCFQCGSRMLANASECGNCGTRYISEEIPDSIESLEAESPTEFRDHITMIDTLRTGIAYFDVDQGRILSVEPEISSKDKLFECAQCKTVIEFFTNKCPLCGAPVSKIANGIEEIVAGADYDKALISGITTDVFCPICGENVHLIDDNCPGCGNRLISASDDENNLVHPLISQEKVVFVHLNVRDGELSYLRIADEDSERGKTVCLRGDGLGSD